MTDEALHPKPATDATRRSHARFREMLDFEDRRSFEDARRGFIATLDPMTIAHGSRPHPVLDMEPF